VDSVRDQPRFVTSSAHHKLLRTIYLRQQLRIRYKCNIHI